MSISRVVACNGVIDPVNALTVIVNIDPFLSLGAPFVASFADLCIPDFFFTVVLFERFVLYFVSLFNFFWNWGLMGFSIESVLIRNMGKSFFYCDLIFFFHLDRRM